MHPVGRPALAMRPPARRMRIVALVLSFFAVAFAIAFGFPLRAAWKLGFDTDAYLVPMIEALVLLLCALVLRMLAAICELLWLERTWSNLPEQLRKVGPLDKVTGGLVLGLSFVPGIAWFWKLGLVMAIADGFESMRAHHAFRAPVPKTLGMVAVIVGWVPGLNLYVAPFLWEVFATRIDAVCGELQLSASPSPPGSGPP
jgi:hypothetical protein